ncbi:MAG: glycoside hydrolase family 97 C-terminal domain-containing protein, partial [Bacteroidetes bacterium]|nr:glycoside hydrolase family 97 C-terminal domain-containing protein [Bacteroidota bacterium]
GQDEWYLGAIADENARVATAPLNFLETGKNYVATLYLDGDKAHWKDNPMEYQIQKFVVTTKTILKLKLAAGGGAAVSIKPASPDELKNLKKYSVK